MGGASLRLSQMAALLLLAVIALLPSSTVAQGVPEMAGCDERGINCVEVTTPGNLTFQCRVAGPEDGTPVLLLHGFPEFSIYWQPLLEYWADENRSDTNSLRAVACDLRGYSPLASPDSPDEYLYETLAGDVYAIADSMGIDAFHLVGHDHGAGLGWLVAAMNTDQRVLSYTAMSLPHPRALSAALHGPDRVEEQLVASNYFNQFMLNESATLNDGALTTMFQEFGMDPGTPEAFQKQLWWYYGSVGRQLAKPAVVGPAAVEKYLPGSALTQAVQAAIPLEEEAGANATLPVEPLNGVPTLLLCALEDPYLLCGQDWAFQTADVINANYSFYGVEGCEHGMLSVGQGACRSDMHVREVMEQVTAHIVAANASSELPPGSPPDPSSDAAAPTASMVIMAVLVSVGMAALGWSPWQ